MAAIPFLLAGCTGADSPPPQPAASSSNAAAEDAVVKVRQADFQISYVLEGITAAGDAVALTPDTTYVLQTDLADGAVVARGDTIGTVRIAPDIAETLEKQAETSNIDKSRLDQLRQQEGAATAPVGGAIQNVATGPSIAAEGIDVVVNLTPLQTLRYRSTPFAGTATVETVMGQRAAPCEATWLEQATDDGNPAEQADTGMNLHCRLPAFLETAPGLRSVVKLESAQIQGAAVVPSSYLGYDQGADTYTLTVMEAGTERVVPVEVGITDGVVRVLESGPEPGTELVRPEREQ